MEMKVKRNACVALGLICSMAVAGPSVVEPAKGYNCWPMIQSIGNRLVCVYTMGPSHNPGEKGRGTYARHSDDAGATWSERATVTVDPRCGETPVAKGLDENGAALFWVRRYGPKSLFALYRTTDGVKFELVSEPKLDKGPWMQITDVFKVPGVGLMSLWFGGSYNDDDRPRRWGTATSADNGRTWSFHVKGENMKLAFWPTEQSAVYLGDGRILAIARTEGASGRQLQLQSVDNGATWRVEATNIRDVGASTPSLIYDEKTGLLSNYYYHRGPGILRRRTAKVYEVWDHPMAWPRSEVLENDGGVVHHAGNANAVAMGGRHYVTYYSGNERNCAVLVRAADICDRPGDWGTSSEYYQEWESVKDLGRIVTTLGDIADFPVLRHGHQQGIGVSDSHIYLGCSGCIAKLDWNGKPVKAVKTRGHMGDVAWYKGRVYAAWAFGGGRNPATGKGAHMLAVFDEDLNELSRREFPDIPGIDGVTVLDDVIYVGVGAGGGNDGRALHRRNRVMRLGMDLATIDVKDVDIGVDVNHGVQNLVAADGKIYGFFYTHLGSRPGSPITCGVFDRDMKLLETRQAYSGQGIDVAPKRFQTVPGRTVFVKGGSSFPKPDSPAAFKRIQYGFFTMK